MSFDYIIEKDNSTFELTKEQENILVKNISSSFVSLNSERAKNLEMASSLANEIFFKNDFKSLTDKTKKWKTKVKMCKTFMFYQTLKAFIWRNTYANVNSTPIEKGLVTIDYTTLAIGENSEGDEIFALKKESDILTVPVHLEELMKEAIITRTMLNTIASETDENYSAYLKQADKAYKLLVKYSKGVGQDKVIKF
jgi:hypothetical protein